MERNRSYSSPPLYTCALSTRKGIITISLDRTRPARKRFLKLTKKGSEFRPVPGLGEPIRGKIGAYFLFSRNHLFIYRKKGSLDFYLPTATPDAEALAAETRLARFTLALLEE